MEIKFTLNGTEYIRDIRADMRALDFIRDEMKMKSVKEGCGEGECGACTVLLNGDAVCSCLLFAGELDGKVIMTSEGLGTPDDMHPIQKAFVDEGGVQCGFCTPGFILSTKALLDKNPDPTEEEIKKALEGNLCRCTGYQKIIDSVKLAAKLVRESN
ncbi:MAG TPA: (2Fe-2S)-binding protein [Thermotogota bacterium]|nr:(2Fe-2S)-binding protein [Thermotogota bacterium]HPJ88226.1 (2Fe-2S)-binding protein [Thermotogota bacterium]HPR96075.1 (2Fe-2S)-binding protein [Thermotogota bacterium]